MISRVGGFSRTKLEAGQNELGSYQFRDISDDKKADLGDDKKADLGDDKKALFMDKVVSQFK